MDAKRPRVPGELIFAVAMLLFGLTALWLAWRIAGFSSWSSPGVMPMIADGRDERFGAGDPAQHVAHASPIPAGSTLPRQFFHQRHAAVDRAGSRH